MGRNFVFGCVLIFLFFIFLFSLQNQVPQIIIGQCRVIYKIEDLLVAMRTTIKNAKKILSVGFKIFDFRPFLSK